MASPLERNSEVVPDGWSLKTIRELCQILSGGTPSKSNTSFWRGNIPWVSGKDMKSPRLYDSIDHIDEAGLSAGSRLAPTGAVFLLVRGMGLAKDLPVAVAKCPMAFNQDIKALIPHSGISGAFLRAAIYQRRDQLLSRIVPSAHGTMTLNLDDVENFSVPLPIRSQSIKRIAKANAQSPSSARRCRRCSRAGCEGKCRRKATSAWCQRVGMLPLLEMSR
jgi:type I restriction enzyme S subunit